MHSEFLMGNEAIALGALASGVNLVCGYPGTPSTEVLETVAKRRGEGVYVEWSVNEKVAMEMAGGAAYAGARALVTMKQMGLNVASDPLMCLEYIGVKGGLVVLVADDPGPISSQTEQDTRSFAAFSKVPLFDPSSAEEAYQMVQEAFELSEKYQTPVFLRPTTRVSHGYASVRVKDPEEYTVHTPEGFVRDSSRWVIFPRLSFNAHRKIEERNEALQDVFSENPLNRIEPEDAAAAPLRKGVAVGGFSYTYVMEARKKLGALRTLKVSTPFPFPEKKAVEFLSGLDEVLCVEELDPVIERELIYLCGKYGLKTKILGKMTGQIPRSGENSRDSVTAALAAFIGRIARESETHGVQAVIVFNPAVGIADDGGLYTITKPEQLAAFRSLCAENGVRFLDLTDVYMRAYYEQHLLPSGFSNTAPARGHLNAVGHRLIAETVYAAIREWEG